MCPAPTNIRPEMMNILYVDDEENNLVSFVAAFRKSFNVFTAISAREAIEILNTYPIHVLITDQRMPDMTGIQLLEAILPDYPHVVCMILTGFSDIEAIIRAINTGRVFRYITKPWDETELKMILDSAVKIYNLEKENRTLAEKIQDELVNQERIISTFKKYVPADIVSEVLDKQDALPLIHGERRIVSVLFSDIRSFTSISSHLDPFVVVDYLNNYFSIMTECVKKNKGSVNKFLGDGILAVFGAPISYMDNPYNAISCGLDMIKELAKFNKKFSNLVKRDIDIAIGINTGEVIVGNIGSTDRMEYTVVGDTVNIASRICQLAKVEPNTLYISESTYLSAMDLIQAEKLEPQTIRGREGEVILYKVLGVQY